jgi:hypothetical protein
MPAAGFTSERWFLPVAMECRVGPEMLTAVHSDNPARPRTPWAELASDSPARAPLSRSRRTCACGPYVRVPPYASRAAGQTPHGFGQAIGSSAALGKRMRGGLRPAIRAFSTRISCRVMSPRRECSARRPAHDVGGVQHHPARRGWFHEGLTMTTDPPARAASRATCSARNFERL